MSAERARRSSPARGCVKPLSADWSALRGRLALAAKLRAIADAKGRDDRWIASQLRVDESRLAALFGGIVPTADERERIETFIAASG